MDNISAENLASLMGKFQGKKLLVESLLFMMFGLLTDVFIERLRL